MGQVRIPVTIDKAEEAVRELRKIITSLKGVEEANRSQAVTLQKIGEAFTPFRRNIEVVNQLRGAFNQFSGAIGTVLQGYRAIIAHNTQLNSRFQAVERSWDRLITSFARGVNKTGEVADGLDSINNALTRLGPVAEFAGAAFVSAMQTMARQAIATLTANPFLAQILSLAAGAGIRALGADVVAEPALARLEIDPAYFGEAGESSQEHMQRLRREAQERERDARQANARQRAAARAGAGERERIANFYSQAGSSGGSAAAQLGTEEAIADQYRAQTEALREQLHLMDLRNAAAEFQQSIASASFDAQRQAFEKHLDDQKRLLEIEQEIADQREEQVGTYLGQVGAIASATQNLGKAVASAYESMGGSSEKAKKVEGAFVVAYSSVMAALELAESIRAFAKQDYVSGALHLIGMAAYIAAAVEAGSQLGGGAAKTPSAQTSYTPARTEGLAAESGEQAGTTIVNQYSWGRSRAEAAVAVADIEYEGARTGRVRGADAGVWGA